MLLQERGLIADLAPGEKELFEETLGILFGVEIFRERERGGEYNMVLLLLGRKRFFPCGMKRIDHYALLVHATEHFRGIRELDEQEGKTGAFARPFSRVPVSIAGPFFLFSLFSNAAQTVIFASVFRRVCFALFPRR